jgi:hypothetical protein
LYFVISASAVERDFSGAAVAGAVFPESDMVARGRERTELNDENEETKLIRLDLTSYTLPN